MVTTIRLLSSIRIYTVYIYFNIKVEMHQSYRKATAVRPWGHCKESASLLSRWCNQLLHVQEIWSPATTNTITQWLSWNHMFNSNVVEIMISIYKRVANKALLGRITHGKTQKPKWVPKFNPLTEFKKKWLE